MDSGVVAAVQQKYGNPLPGHWLSCKWQNSSALKGAIRLHLWLRFCCMAASRGRDKHEVSLVIMAACITVSLSSHPDHDPFVHETQGIAHASGLRGTTAQGAAPAQWGWTRSQPPCCLRLAEPAPPPSQPPPVTADGKQSQFVCQERASEKNTGYVQSM